MRKAGPARDRQRNRALPTNSTAWRSIRASVLRAEPLCRSCKAQGRLRPASQVDHIDGDAHNNEPANLQPLCATCHSRKTAESDGGFGNARGERGGIDPITGWPTDERHHWNAGPPKQGQTMDWRGRVIEDKSRDVWQEVAHVPSIKAPACRLIIVCGPPASGKTTHVRQHMAPSDIVLDADQIALDVFGRPLYELSRTEFRQVFRERNDVLGRLHAEQPHRTCWLIATAGTPGQRKRWARHGEVRVIFAPAEACIERVKARDLPPWVARGLIGAIRRWH